MRKRDLLAPANPFLGPSKKITKKESEKTWPIIDVIEFLKPHLEEDIEGHNRDDLVAYLERNVKGRRSCWKASVGFSGARVTIDGSQLTSKLHRFQRSPSDGLKFFRSEKKKKIDNGYIEADPDLERKSEAKKKLHVIEEMSKENEKEDVKKQKKKKKKSAPSKKRKRESCKYFAAGFCREGKKCSFPHDSGKDENCKFWMAGYCKDADCCGYRHDFSMQKAAALPSSKVGRPWANLDRAAGLICFLIDRLTTSPRPADNKRRIDFSDWRSVFGPATLLLSSEVVFHDKAVLVPPAIAAVLQSKIEKFTHEDFKSCFEAVKRFPKPLGLMDKVNQSDDMQYAVFHLLQFKQILSESKRNDDWLLIYSE